MRACDGRIFQAKPLQVQRPRAGRIVPSSRWRPPHCAANHAASALTRRVAAARKATTIPNLRALSAASLASVTIVSTLRSASRLRQARARRDDATKIGLVVIGEPRAHGALGEDAADLGPGVALFRPGGRRSVARPQQAVHIVARPGGDRVGLASHRDGGAGGRDADGGCRKDGEHHDTERPGQEPVAAVAHIGLVLGRVTHAPPQPAGDVATGEEARDLDPDEPERGGDCHADRRTSLAGER